MTIMVANITLTTITDAQLGNGLSQGGYLFRFFSSVLCTVEKFKFSEFLLDDKNGTYLSSYTISTLNQITSDALNFVVNTVVTQYCVYYEI